MLVISNARQPSVDISYLQWHRSNLFTAIKTWVTMVSTAYWDYNLNTLPLLAGFLNAELVSKEKWDFKGLAR